MINSDTKSLKLSPSQCMSLVYLMADELGLPLTNYNKIILDLQIPEFTGTINMVPKIKEGNLNAQR